jgi:quercetin dioxygenase-like cupin family protein
MVIDSGVPARQFLVGPDQRAERLLVVRSEWPAEFFVGLHRHDGEEAFYVLEGRVRFTLDGTHIECTAGQATTVPAGGEHGFVVLEDATILVIREQRLGSIAISLQPDGERQEVEIFQYGPPWSKQPPAGSDLTPPEIVRQIYETTRHLL